MITVILNTKEIQVDISDLTDKLSSVGITVGIISDLRFCPYIICYKNPDDGTVEIDSINEGFLSTFKRNSTTVEADSVTGFIEACISIKKDDIVQNTLF